LIVGSAAFGFSEQLLFALLSKRANSIEKEFGDVHTDYLRESRKPNSGS